MGWKSQLVFERKVEKNVQSEWYRSVPVQTNRWTFIPLGFQPGEAFQVDWREDWANIGGERVKLQVAHIEQPHSRAFLVRPYPLQTHEILFDAHWHPLPDNGRGSRCCRPFARCRGRSRSGFMHSGCLPTAQPKSNAGPGGSLSTIVVTHLASYDTARLSAQSRKSQSERGDLWNTCA